MADPQTLIEQYVAGELSQDEHAELVRWLSADEANRQAFLAEVDFYRTVRGVLVQEQSELARNSEADDESPFDAPQPTIQLDAEKLTKKQYASALSYVIRHTFTPKRIATLATAAALMLGMVLAIVLLTGPDENEQLVEVPDQIDPIEVLPSINPTVATLTATHNAQWAEGASAPGSLTPGSKLHPNTRLTLTAGFAEITTNNGAIAILEAPATIELLDHENALRLHTGKLVGICETQSSKGFVVKTDHAEITDIGTEFGVEISPIGVTNLQVFRGEVSAVAIGQGGIRTSPQAIVAGQAANLSKTDGLKRIGMKPGVFSSIRGHKLSDQIKEPFEPTLSLVPGDTESNDFMLLIPERKSVLLERPLEVMMPASNPTKLEHIARRTLDTGTHLNSYIVHFDIDEQTAESDTITLRGEVRFDQPILGVILENIQLHETARLFGSSEVQYDSSDQKTGIDGSSDKVSISPDGKTLRLELSAWVSSARGIDQVRVLVQAKSPTE